MDPNRPGGPPPGWYPDPLGAKAWRWWDGYAWTGYASDPSGPSQVPGMAASRAVEPSVQDRFTAELDAGRWARPALFGYVVLLALTMLFAWGIGPTLREIVRDIRNQVQPVVVQPLRLDVLNTLVLVVEVPYFVLLLRWQFLAAKTARLLSLPARRSAGLGVGSWFIPVVNFWFPYQAIRDCLPPGDGGRSTVGRMWAFYISTTVTAATTQILALVGNPVGFAFAAFTLALALGFAVEGARAVRLIGDAHRRLLFPGSTGGADQPTSSGS